MSETDFEATCRNVEDFNNSFVIQEDKALDAVRQNTAENNLPLIHVSPAQGKYLYLVARSINAKRILEVGTLGGYSSIWLARALPEGGKVTTLELRPEHAKVAQQNITTAGVADKVEIIIGSASDTLKAMQYDAAEPFDFVFVDADSMNVHTYMAEAKRLVRPGGVIIVDNVVRHGTVADLNNPDELNGPIREMFSNIKNDPEIEATIISTVGIKYYDGYLYAVKK